jgi:hypothetical protein
MVPSAAESETLLSAGFVYRKALGRPELFVLNCLVGAK